MPDVVIDDTIRITQSFTLGNGDIMQNVLHFFCTSVPALNTARALECSTLVVDAWDVELQALINTDVAFVLTKVQDLRSVPYPTFDFDQTISGAAAASVLPYQLAAVASLRTAHAGRSGRGRIYLGGFEEGSNNADGQIETATRTAISDWCDALITGAIVGGGAIQLAVCSRLEAQSFPVTSVTVDNRWDVQRRRANRRL